MNFRFRWKQVGEHVHVRVFVGEARDLPHGRAGKLTLDTAQWAIFREHIERRFEIVQENGDLP